MYCTTLPKICQSIYTHIRNLCRYVQMHKCASVNAMTKQTRQFGERAMLFDVKTHHICGKSARKNHQKHTTWWQKIKTWDTTPLLVPTKSSLKRTFTKKTARRSATCANQFVKMIAKKTHHVVAKKQNCECVCTTLCCTVKTPLAQLYQICTQRTILQK